MANAETLLADPSSSSRHSDASVVLLWSDTAERIRSVVADVQVLVSYLRGDDWIRIGLRSVDPYSALVASVVQKRRQGASRDALVASLQAAARELRESGQDGDEDVVVEVLDRLTGFCPPDMDL